MAALSAQPGQPGIGDTAPVFGQAGVAPRRKSRRLRFGLSSLPLLSADAHRPVHALSTVAGCRYLVLLVLRSCIQAEVAPCAPDLTST